MIRNFGYILVFFALTLLTACSQSDIEVNPQDVTLDLTVVVNDGGISNNSSTRAFPDTEDGSFEAPANDREKLSTLRVIIVHTVDGKQVVEHNRMVGIDYNTGNVINDNLQFRVKSNESKQIYLFGNEKWAGFYNGSTAVWEPIYNFDALLPGSEFPIAEIEALQIRRAQNQPVLDNTGTNYTRYGFVPMSEFFTVEIPEPHGEADRFIAKTLFVTRSLVKFSFNFTVSDDFWQEGARIAGVRVEGMADNCYYLPNNTVYSPGKYEVSTEDLEGRYITSFEDPSTVTYSNCDLGMTLPFPEINSDLKGDKGDYYPLIYLPETKAPAGGTIRVSLLLEGSNQWLTSQPLQLTELPRNTHLKVNVTLKSTTIAPEVELLPYTGVNLNPDFGI